MNTLTPLAKTSIIVSWLVVGLACVSTSLHLFFVLRIRRGSASFDDFCVWLALFIGIILVAQTTWAIVDEGSGKHQSDLTEQNIAAIAKSVIVNEVLWSFCGALLRISGCCILRKIFGVFSVLKWIITAILCLSVVHGIASVLEVCLICQPIEASWDPNVKGLCGNQIASFLAVEIIGLGLDMAMLLAPIPVTISLRIPLKTRIGIIVIFELGLMLFIVTGLRLKALKLAASTDFTYSKSYLGLLSSVGCMLGVMICVGPIVPGMFRHLKERGITAKISPLKIYVSEMTTSLRRTKPHSTGLAVSATKLGIMKSTETPSTDRGHRDGTQPIPTCVCGKQHWYTNCFILNPRHPARPKTFQPTAEALHKVEEARKDPKTDARINTALEKWAARQLQSAGSLQVDEGKSSANFKSCAISIGPSLTSLDYDGQDGQDDDDEHNCVGHDDQVVIDIDSRTETVGDISTTPLMRPPTPIP
ncbi:hypothetical protein NX059_002893 [Plenodomus lindquistii]|nr:hypothetical protein NX059_002893 [Plenodomus lindquistii]